MKEKCYTNIDRLKFYENTKYEGDDDKRAATLL